jgi:hypothetical protein
MLNALHSCRKKIRSYCAHHDESSFWDTGWDIWLLNQPQKCVNLHVQCGSIDESGDVHLSDWRSIMKHNADDSKRSGQSLSLMNVRFHSWLHAHFYPSLNVSEHSVQRVNFNYPLPHEGRDNVILGY